MIPGRLIKTILLAAGALVACLISFVQVATPKTQETGWFVPQLTAGDPSECAPLLAGARTYFAGKDVDGYPNPLGPSVPGLHAISHDVNSDALEKAAIKPYQLKIETIVGCGQGCNTGTVTVLVKGKAAFTTPAANPWSEYTNGKDRDYLAGIVGRQAEVYRVTGSGKSALACRIMMEPDFERVTDGNVLAALKAVDVLYQASLGMSRAGGDCGTLGTPERWQENVDDALHRTLYRPWSLATKGDVSSANSNGDYDRILQQLKLWSLGGFSEHAAFQLYQDRIATTEKLLADFYVKRFGWKVPKAHSVARSALTNAIAGGFGFYLYKPFKNDEEMRLRAALLDQAPISDIQAIPLDVKLLDPIFSPDFLNEGRDSILDVAISYPQALQYLLDKGFDPNRANSFGKTPLMYAAQYNQIEAARLLLKAGADPNARTTRPPEDCGYSLTTFSMTPLHYAVRNAGMPLIELLLHSGAATFIKVSTDNDEKPGMPIDWLHRYTSGAPSTEQNPNLSPQDVATLAKPLTPPAPAALPGIASAQVLLAEREAAAGHDEAAYQAVTVALLADPDNQKGLADLPLLALKTQRKAEAANAATRAIADLTTDTGKASAWFNLGMICQSVPNTERLTYDGKDYCRSDDRVHPFLRAWQIAPTDVRAHKLLQLMAKDGLPANVRSCILDGRSYRVMADEHGDGQYVLRVYVLHRADETIDPKSISWMVHWADKPASALSPDLAGRYVLGDQTLTVLESVANGGVPMTIDGQVCGTY